MPTALAGELVLLVSADKKRFVVRLTPGEEFHTHKGYLAHNDLIGLDMGSTVLSHTGKRFVVLRPSFEELLMTVRRATQIMYPKDIGYILLKLTVQPGATVVEAGSGSGALTCALARYVTPGGHVHTYEARADMLSLAQTNIARLGLEGSVTFHQRDVVADGFDVTDAEAVFLDLREPWLALHHAAAALQDGGFLGALVPTINQVTALASGLERRRDFTDVEIAEIMLRLYKTTAARVRPLDRMTAHTGYLIFARKIARGLVRPDETSEEPEENGRGDMNTAEDLAAAGADDPPTASIPVTGPDNTPTASTRKTGTDYTPTSGTPTTGPDDDGLPA